MFLVCKNTYKYIFLFCYYCVDIIVHSTTVRVLAIYRSRFCRHVGSMDKTSNNIQTFCFCLSYSCATVFSTSTTAKKWSQITMGVRIINCLSDTI